MKKEWFLEKKEPAANDPVLGKNPQPRGISDKYRQQIEAYLKAKPVKKADDADANDLSKPYVSEAQRRWAHTENGIKALGGKKNVHEWDEATKGKKLPEKIEKSRSPDDEGHLVRPPGSLKFSKPPGARHKNAGVGYKPHGGYEPSHPPLQQGTEIASKMARHLEEFPESHGDHELEKSNYGPKGGGQYTAADNVRRKQANAGDQDTGIQGIKVKSGANSSGGQGKQKLNAEVRAIHAKNRKQPVKIYSEEEKRAFAQLHAMKQPDKNKLAASEQMLYNQMSKGEPMIDAKKFWQKRNVSK